MDNKTTKECIRELGENKACVIAMEELAELTQAISKGIRGKLNYNNLCEEIADTIIATKWIEEVFAVDKKDVQKWIDFKTNRCKERIANHTLD